MSGADEKWEHRTGTIAEAFCFETDSMDGPFLAREKLFRSPGLHYFCPTEGCAYPMKGTRFIRRDGYDIVCFVSQNIQPGVTRTHIQGCPFGRMRRSSPSRSGEPIRTNQTAPITNEPTPFIPIYLVTPDEITRRDWPKMPPTPSELRDLIGMAKVRPPAGLIEDVMAADRFMADAFAAYMQEKRARTDNGGDRAGLVEPVLDKRTQRLIVGGHDTTYADGIVYLTKAFDHIGEPDFWNTHIIKITGEPRFHLATGDYYLNTGRGKFFIRITAKAFTGSGSKSYTADLFEQQIASKGRIYCYWWGLAPKDEGDGRGAHIVIRSPEDMMRIGFQEAPPKTAE